MFRISRRRPWPPVLDTKAVRAELVRIHNDLKHVPNLAPASMLLLEAIEELENAEAREQLTAKGWNYSGDFFSLRRPRS